MTTAAAARVAHARAPGKINVFLKVGAQLRRRRTTRSRPRTRRSRSARTCTPTRRTTSRWTSPAPIDTAGLASDGSNLAIRAATLLARKTGYRGGVRLEIGKNVPVAGGMGGGSADAAATLLACDALWGTELPREELLALAVQLGPDVPFAFIGGTAIGTGRGDQISPALAMGHFQWVLAFADFDMQHPRGVSRNSIGTATGTRRTSSPPRCSRASTPTCCRRCAPAIRTCSPSRCTTTCRRRRCTSNRDSPRSSNWARRTARSPG